MRRTCRHDETPCYGKLKPTDRKNRDYWFCVRCGRKRVSKPTCVRCGLERKLHRTRISNGNGGGQDAYWNLCRSCRKEERSA